MKILRTCIIALLSIVMLTGCVKLDLALEVNTDSTISGSMIFAVSDSLTDLGADASSGLPAADSLVDSKADGVTVMPYKKDGFTGSTYTFDRVPFSAFKSDGSTGNDIKVERTGNQIKLTGALDFSYGDSTDASDPFSNLLAQSISSSADMKISVKFPVKVLSSTGTISEDGKTVTWIPKLGEKLDLTTTVEIPKALQFKTQIVYAFLGLFVILILVIFLRKKNEKSKSVGSEFDI
jgi:hypothetical protein